jgi:phosphoribosylamine--glycine ligase
VDLVDVAQDSAVKAGLVNTLNLFKIPAVGPTRAAGEIEWNKQHARIFGEYHGLPQPKYMPLATEAQAEKYLDTQENTRWFVKATGLADGKGAVPATSKREVLDAIKLLKKEYPNSAKTFLIEEWIEGEEFSAFAISDSRNFKILGYAQDHKREGDGDVGENTGGMGAVSHPLLITSEIENQTKEIFNRTITRLKDSGDPYRGVLYLGGMVKDEKVKIIEFNARWGDPEAQVIVPGLKVDLFEMGMESARGTLRRIKISDDGKARVAVAGVARGYPRFQEYSQVQGKEIKGLDEAGKTEGVTIYGAGVKIENKKHYVKGGRLFYVVGEGQDVAQARNRAYDAMEKINIDGDNLHYRKDIGWRDVERLGK